MAREGDAARAAALAAGAVLAAWGLRRRSVPGLIAAGVGGVLAYQGVSGLRRRAAEPQGDGRLATRGMCVSEAFTIDKPREELYAFWRNFENLPRFMGHLQSVRVIDEARSHWVTRAPSIAGGSVGWDAQILEDIQDQKITWRSLPQADVDHTGSVAFQESPRGTVVRVEMRYVAPGGRLGGWIARLFGEGADRQVREDLRAFKRMMETGEAPTTRGQPRGTCART